MSKKDFECFLEKHKTKHQEKKHLDWQKRKQEWFNHLAHFYEQVQKWLKQYQEQGKVTIRFEPITLNEEYIGSYETQTLHLMMANQEVVFTPIGTMLFGSKGRIDMEGKAGKVRFLLVNKESTQNLTVKQIFEDENQQTDEKIDWKWKIATPPPSIHFIEFNEDAFFNALMEVMNE